MGGEEVLLNYEAQEMGCILRHSSSGKMKGIAFIKDPDGYWIEIFDRKTIGNVTEGAA
ncbi:lactoylglutathione lyase-like protein [Trifolium pratense]|uniref:Lactoylglutathione lyase-like protein n=1 Tax=Trifolium pratense TaxID=57577 RepID=A0A2K3L3D3_TRIPR|nr:lactoylglutathione lyase-like protein [Trifolium pratense]